VNNHSVRDELDRALQEISDTPFESLTDEVAALEKTHEILTAKLSAAGE